MAKLKLSNTEYGQQSTVLTSEVKSDFKTAQLLMTVLLGEVDSLCSDRWILFHPLQTVCTLPLAFPWRCELQRNSRRTADSSVAQKRHARRGRGGQELAVRLCFCHCEQTGATVWVCESVRGDSKHAHKQASGWLCARTNTHTHKQALAHRLVPTKLA